MSRAHEPHRHFLPFGNPFRNKLSPKGSCLSPKPLDLLNSFEVSLAGRIKKLKPAGKEDVLQLSWMRLAMETLCEIHTDIKTLITALELPISDWDEKWIDVYLDDSVKLLDICIAFTSEISQLKQGHLFLQCILHNLCGAAKQFPRACSSLDGWKKHIASKNPRFSNCFSAMDELSQKLDLPKMKNSVKGNVLMRAMYGVKMVSLLVCNIFAAVFSGSAKKLMDLHLAEACLWSEAFVDLQTFVNTGIRSLCSSEKVIVVKELEAVDTCVKNLCPMVQGDGVEAELLKGTTSELGKSAEQLSERLGLLAKEVDGFFQIVLSGRDALLGSLRIGGDVALSSNKVGGLFFS